MAGEGGFPSASDGNVEVDSNTGTVEDLQRELASEVSVTEADGRRSSKPAEPPAAAAGDEAEGEGEELEGGEDAGGAPVVGKAAEAKPGEAGKPAKKRSLQARIDAINREKFETARARDAAFAERDALKAEIAALKNPTNKDGRPAADAGKPAAVAGAGGRKVGGVPIDAEKFPKYSEWLTAGNDGELEDWVDSRDEWKEARATEHAAAETAKREHSQRFTGRAATFNERMAPVLEAEPEFYEKIDPRLTETPAMSALPPGVKPTFGNFLVEQVVVSEHPKELMEHLSGKKTIQRLATLQPDEIIREIARFELSLGEPAARRSGPAGRATDDDDEEESSESDAAAIQTSRAQPPAKPVRGSSHEHKSPDEEPGDDASDDEWFRWNKKQEAKAGARG